MLKFFYLQNGIEHHQAQNVLCPGKLGSRLNGNKEPKRNVQLSMKDLSSNEATKVDQSSKTNLNVKKT